MSPPLILSMKNLVLEFSRSLKYSHYSRLHFHCKISKDPVNRSIYVVITLISLILWEQDRYNDSGI